MGKIYPEGTFVTNGLSKSHAAGGYRLGYVIFPQHALDVRRQFKKILATEYTAVTTPIQLAAVAGFQVSKEMNEYFQITRKIHQIMGEYVYEKLHEIPGVTSTKPQATFYLLADFNRFTPEFNASKISTSQKFSETLIQHPYHTAIVGGDSLVLERTDYSARMAFVDYDGKKAFDAFRDDFPKSHSDKIEFVKTNAPRVVSGLKMIETYFDHLLKNAESKIDCDFSSLSVVN
jgi:aspartate aminotransferase